MQSSGRTLFDLAHSLAGRKDLDFWFQWPPDLFALTSMALARTGVYRYAVSPPQSRSWPNDDPWPALVETEAQEWLIELVREVPSKLEAGRHRKQHQATVGELWKKVHLSQLRKQSRGSGAEVFTDEEWKLIKALLELHAIADETCRGFGLPLGGTSYRRFKDKPKGFDDRLPLVFLHANTLLCLKGSLSRLPSSELRVLPKMRVPQSGLTLRSLSHHVTVHRSEVEVVWRTAPWINRDDNILNVLVVPWPYKLQASAFKPFNANTIRRQSHEPHRFFSFDPAETEDDKRLADIVVEMLEVARHDHGQIHLVVFPEQALKPQQLMKLQSRLAAEAQGAQGAQPPTIIKGAQPPTIIKGTQPPMIITGLRGEDSTGDAGRPRNRVVLSVYFGGRWYSLRQDKHHRWKLNRSQIQTYRLAGVLSPERSWWEAIDIPDRRISFFAPSSWITLCPLICEDLARLEPVSDVIRGVGPSLAVAVLLDGPQLSKRWPGRYATVLAEDPGTSVLSVTALGMVERSLAQPLEPTSDTEVPRRDAVALWKDQVHGAQEISLREAEAALVLSLSATLEEEYSADGRGDGGGASVFALQQIYRLRKDQLKLLTKADPKPPSDQANAAKAAQPAAVDETLAFESAHSWDLEELSLFSFFLDAAFGTTDPAIVDTLARYLLNELPAPLPGLEDAESQLLLRALVQADSARARRGQVDQAKYDYQLVLRIAVRCLKDLCQGPANGKDQGSLVRLRAALRIALGLLGEVEASGGNTAVPEGLGSAQIEQAIWSGEIKHSEHLRAKTYVGLGLLWALHKRASALRRRSFTQELATLMTDIEEALGNNWETWWIAAKVRERAPGARN